MIVNMYTPIFKDDDSRDQDGGVEYAHSAKDALKEFQTYLDYVIAVEKLGTAELQEWELEEKGLI